jgi:uncharacterized membrane protein (DUF4010 family)
LAIIFIIYPLLPEGNMVRTALAPRRIWLFVILVSSISFVGYFLQKFLGPAKGGLDQRSGRDGFDDSGNPGVRPPGKENPPERTRYWSAAVIANAIQFPRVLAILWAVNSALAAKCALQFLAVMTAGLLLGGIVYFREEAAGSELHLPSGNPFRLAPRSSSALCSPQ